MESRAHLRVLGVPVRIELLFVLVAFMFGMYQRQVWMIFAFVVLVFISILVHEMGHALAYRFVGQRSAIVLHGFGGFTVPTGGGRRVLSKGQSIAVSLAGIAFQLLLLYLPARYLLSTDWMAEQHLIWAVADSHENWNFNWYPVLSATAFINLWWAVFNALPIRPLDGGHVAEELVGFERACKLSIGAAVAAGLLALSSRLLIAALMMGFFAFQNYRDLKVGANRGIFDLEAPQDPSGGDRPRRERRPRQSRRGRRSRHLSAVPDHPDISATPRESDVESAIWNELRDGDPDRAAAMLRQTGSANLFLQGSVALAQGHPSIAIDLLEQAYAGQPDGPPNLVAAGLLADSEQAVELTRALVSNGSSGLTAAGSLQTHLHYAGRYRTAAEVGELLFAAGPASPAQTAFEVACAWSRAGDSQEGLRWIEAAIDAGFKAPGILDKEPDLLEVRTLPGWSSVRAKLT